MELQKLNNDQSIKLNSLGFPLEYDLVVIALEWIRKNKGLDLVVQPYYPGYPEDKKLQYNSSVVSLDPDSDFSEDLGDTNSHNKAEIKALNFMIKHLLNSEQADLGSEE
jgi:hypothetical protein